MNNEHVVFTWEWVFTCGCMKQVLENIIQEGRAWGQGIFWEDAHLVHRMLMLSSLWCVSRLQLESIAGVYSPAEYQPLRPWSTDAYIQQPSSRTYVVGRLHKCPGTTNFPKAKWCIGVGNFNKFAGTLQLGKGCLKLVSRHKELFRKWLAFQATPKNTKILYIQWDPWNNNYLCFHCPEVWGSKQTNSHFPYLELVCCYFL